MIDLNKHWKNRGFMTEQKYIALIDCDSFFVSCERKLNPKLNAKPVCVVSGERGCVIARSIEAKEMGFLIVNVVTNGTFKLDLPEADLILLSLDGDKVHHNDIRGDTFDTIMKNIVREEFGTEIEVEHPPE